MAQSVGAVALDIVMGKNTVSGVAKSAMQDVQKTFSDGSANVGQKIKSIGGACSSIGASLAPVSAAAQGVITKTVQAAQSFEDAMAKVSTIAGNTAVKYKGSTTSMSNAVKQLSTDTGMAAEDVAEATYSAISAGVDTAESVNFVSQANALAVGGFTDISTSVDVLTTTINAYGLKAKDAQSISDKLITTQNLGKTTVGELASSMGKVIPSASAYGVSIDNVCAGYVAMTKGGIATAESTTYMKSMLNELASSSSNVGKVLQQKTGKSFAQLMKSGKSLGDVIQILGDSVGGDASKFAQLWGSAEAGTGALSILNGGTKDFNNTLNEMGNSTGAARRAMDKMNDTSSHKMQIAMNNIKNAAIDLGEAFAPIVTQIADKIADLAKKFQNLPDSTKKTIATILGVTAVASPLLIVIGKVISAVGSISSAVSTGISALKGVGAAAGAVSAPVLAVVAVIGVLVGAFVYLWNTSEDFRNTIIGIWDGIKAKFEEAGQKITDTLNGLGFDFDNFGEVVSAAWNGLCQLLGPVLEGAFQYISNVLSTALDILVGIFQIFAGIFSGDWSTVWEGVKSIFSGIWNGISGFFTNIINVIKNITDVFLGWFGTSWSNIWNGVKTFFVNIWNSIKNFFVNIWNGIKNVVTTVCTAISNFISNIWNTIKSVITGVLNAIKNTVSNIWNGIKNTISSILNGIKNTVSNIWNGIKNVVSSVGGAIKNAAIKVFDSIVGPIKNALGNVKSAVSNVLNGVKDLFTGVISKAVNWGKDLIGGFIDGIKSMIDKVKNVVGDVVDGITSFLHFSRPDEGPLHYYEEWMPDFMEGLASGIENNKYKVTDALSGLSAEMTVNPTINPPQLTSTGKANAATAEESKLDKLYSAINKLVESTQNNNITVPIYLGNDLIDEQIIKANDRRTVRSGGKA